jgi:hypothetical protein
MAQNDHNFKNKFYTTRDKLLELPNYRDLPEGSELKLAIDAMLDGVDFSDPDAIMNFGNETTNELTEKLKARYADTRIRNDVSSKITAIIGHKIEMIDVSEVLQNINVKAGKAYIATSGLVGKILSVFSPKEDSIEIKRRQDKEALQNIAVKIDAQNEQLGWKIKDVEEIDAVLSQDYGCYGALKTHLIKQYLALQEAKMRCDEENQQNSPHIAVKQMQDMAFGQKSNSTVENLLVISATQEQAYMVHGAIKLTKNTLQDFKANGLPLVNFQLEQANIALQTSELVDYAGQVKASKVQLLEAGVEVSGNLLNQSMQIFTANYTSRYIEALNKAHQNLVIADAQLLLYRDQLNNGSASMLAAINGTTPTLLLDAPKGL